MHTHTDTHKWTVHSHTYRAGQKQVVGSSALTGVFCTYFFGFLLFGLFFFFFCFRFCWFCCELRCALSAAAAAAVFFVSCAFFLPNKKRIKKQSKINARPKGGGRRRGGESVVIIKAKNLNARCRRRVLFNVKNLNVFTPPPPPPPLPRRRLYQFVCHWFLIMLHTFGLRFYFVALLFRQ